MKMKRMIFVLALSCLILICSIAIVMAAEPQKAGEEGAMTAEEKERMIEAEIKQRGLEAESRVLGTRGPEGFTLYRLNYAIVGANDAKLQFSFKYRLIKKFNLYFAFTNLLLWDIYEESLPFRDINFMPELFYRFRGKEEWLATLDVGWIHNSNGNDGVNSRGWDRFFAGLNKVFEFDHFNLVWRTNLYLPFNISNENEDIRDYIGFWDTSLIGRRLLGKESENLDLHFTLVSGDHGNPFDKGSIELGAKYGFPKSSFNPYLYLQYFNGYGETILEYNERSEELRFGLAFYY